MGKAAVAGLILLAGIRPAGAQQLTFTTHVEVRKVDDAPPANALLTQFYETLGAGLLEGLMGDFQEPYEFTYVVSERGLRAAGTRSTPLLPSGSVGVWWPDRTLIVLRPADRTFSRLRPSSPPSRLDPESNTLSWKRTGEFAEVSGIKAERVTFENVFTNPAKALMERLAGEPVTVSITGDAWIAGQYRNHAARLIERHADAPFSVPLLTALQKEGLAMRVIFRSQFFDGHEVERVITRISEGPLVPDLFDVPADFRRAGAVEPPQLISRVEALYTAEAARAKIDGDVELLVTIAEDGSVRDPKVIKSVGYGLDEAAMKSVVQWKYRPGRKDGVPVSVVATIHVRFTLRERTRPSP